MVRARGKRRRRVDDAEGMRGGGGCVLEYGRQRESARERGKSELGEIWDGGRDRTQAKQKNARCSIQLQTRRERRLLHREMVGRAGSMSMEHVVARTGD